MPVPAGLHIVSRPRRGSVSSLKLPRKRTFASGIMARPLITCMPEALDVYAADCALDWIEDPSNQDLSFDRNFLRHEIMPLIRNRWPAAYRTLGRSAMRSAAASQTLLGVADEDLETVRMRGTNEFSVSELRSLPRERAYNALRLWVRQSNLRLPRLQDLARVMEKPLISLGRPRLTIWSCPTLALCCASRIVNLRVFACPQMNSSRCAVVAAVS